MAVYKFRVTFEEFDDVHRDIELRSVQTFADFHLAIQEAIMFDNKHEASFYMSDDSWLKRQEITLNKNAKRGKDIPLMEKSRLCDFIIDPHQKIIYIYDFDNQWSFLIELVKISVEEDKKATYPRCIKTIGIAPKQYGFINLGKVPTDLDFIDNEQFEDIDASGNVLPRDENAPLEDSADSFGFADEEAETDVEDMIDDSER